MPTEIVKPTIMTIKIHLATPSTDEHEKELECFLMVGLPSSSERYREHMVL